MSQIDKRDHKIKCDHGMADYYSFYRKRSKNPVSSKIYRALIKEWLEANRELISTKGYIFKFPEQMGRIEVRKIKREVYVNDEGKVINNLPVNWKATKQLWKENEEAKKKKVRIRYTNEHTDGYVFFPVYIKNNATFKNKTIYRMQINRKMTRDTYDGIMDKSLDAFLLYKNNRHV